MSRQVLINSVISDVLRPTNGSNNSRVTGLTFEDFGVDGIFNGSYSLVPLLDGVGVPDIQVSPGSLYINEVTPGSGLYSVRFWPNEIGYQSFIITCNMYTTESNLNYDIIPNIALSSSYNVFYGV